MKLSEFYENDWNRFIDYNIIDTVLVDELDDKMKFLELIITMGYDCKCNYNDIFFFSAYMGLSVVQPSARKKYHDTSEEGTLLTRIPSWL